MGFGVDEKRRDIPMSESIIFNLHVHTACRLVAEGWKTVGTTHAMESQDTCVRVRVVFFLISGRPAQSRPPRL